ncbi:MAG: UPF0280 family protein [Verrucomicrobia bacterium]|nr:UPF0280 family protein [Verrucomicrobiota bacterium]MBU1964889.1 UPF0280 family protein [Pseudomonadota bacterium]
MNRKRVYRTFIHKEAVLRICCEPFEAVTQEIVRQRAILEEYIRRHPHFQHALEPVAAGADAPEVARRMARAANKVGVGPMAAVAGAMAQLAVEAALRAGAEEAIVDNGGDIYLQTVEPVIIGLYPGESGQIGSLAFSLQACDTPLSICSSSGKMGHSLSMGQCDLATVVAKDAALADAAATLAANLVKAICDVEPALNQMVSIDGVSGVMIVKNGHVGLAGKLPPLVKMR